MALLPGDNVKISELVLRINAVTAREGVVTPRPWLFASDDELPETLQETKGDLSRGEITQEIERMNVEQKDALVALFWIGCGDAEPLEKEATKTLARQHHHGLVSRVMKSKPMPIDCMTCRKAAALVWVFRDGWQ